jgi:NTE family protein
MVMDAIGRDEMKGVLIRMGNSARSFDIKAAADRPADGYDDFLSDADVAQAATHPTNLNVLSREAFDRIARHGHEIAELTLATYAPDFSK